MGGIINGGLIMSTGVHSALSTSSSGLPPNNLAGIVPLQTANCTPVAASSRINVALAHLAAPSSSLENQAGSPQSPGLLPPSHFTPPFQNPPSSNVGHPHMRQGAQTAPDFNPCLDIRVNAAGTRDTDDDDSPSAGAPNVNQGGQDRGRGRRRTRNRARQHDGWNAPEESVSSVWDSNDGYAANREHPQTVCKSIMLEPFSMTNEDQEFPIWIQQFEDAVDRGHNPHSQQRHFNFCLQWLPGSLETDAYAIWRGCRHKKTNWTQLKKELEDKFEDPAIRKEWRTNPRALLWDENKMSLQSYCAKVRRYVDAYDEELADYPAAREVQYYSRFVNGLPEDYMLNVTLNMPSKCQKLEKALEICSRFQIYKKSITQSHPEVGASTTFQDQTTQSRIIKNEADIIWLSNRLHSLESRSSSSTIQDPAKSQPCYSGHLPQPRR